MLLRRIPFRTVEVVEVLGLDDVEPGGIQTLQQRDQLCVRDRGTFASVRDKATAPVIDGERVGLSARLNLHSAISDVKKLQAVAVYFFDESADLISDTIETSLPPIEEYIDTNEIFFLRRRR